MIEKEKHPLFFDGPNPLIPLLIYICLDRNYTPYFFFGPNPLI
jgi:hypothetical protein